MSRNFCMGVRDPWCKPKSSVAHGHIYHLDIELSDKCRD